MPRRDYDEDDEDRPRRRRQFDDEEADDDRPRRRRTRDDDEDEPSREKATNGAAITSLVLGILGFCFGLLSGIPAVIFGFVGLSKAKTTKSGGGMAITGMLLGGLTSIAHAAVIIIVLLPLIDSGRWRNKESNKLKQIGIGEHSYHDTMSYLAGPTANKPQDGLNNRPVSDPSRELSWRVDILPFIEQASVYQRFNFSEPWDSPSNRPLGDLVIPTYSDYDQMTDAKTRYRVFYGNGALFELGQRTRITDVTDGTSNTILVIDTPSKITWSQFNELKYDPKAALPPLGRDDKDSILILFADGSVRTVSKKIRESTLRLMITKADGNAVPFE